MGERDIEKKVLELPIPRYKAGDGGHQALADLAARARKRATKLVTSAEFAKSIAARCGWLRAQLRNLLEQIDRKVSDLQTARAIEAVPPPHRCSRGM